MTFVRFHLYMNPQTKARAMVQRPVVHVLPQRAPVNSQLWVIPQVPGGTAVKHSIGNSNTLPGVVPNQKNVKTQTHLYR